MNIYITSYGAVNPFIQPGDDSLPETWEKSDNNRLYCNEPDYKAYIEDPGTRRRMSRTVKIGVAAAIQCLSGTTQQPDAIITATGLGCLADTEKFLKTITDNQEQLLNPTPFIQSTFNTPGAQIAMMQQNMSYNMTYVHRGFSFESALLDSMMKLWDKEAGNVLAGTYEEITDASFKILSRLGFGRNCTLGEGSQFFMLSTQQSSPYILRDVLTVFDSETTSIKEKASGFLQKNHLGKNDIDLFISGKNGDKNTHDYYQAFEDLFDQSTIVNHKEQSGEYPTVSSFSLWIALELMRANRIPDYLIFKNNHRTIKNVLIYNHSKEKNHAFILLEKAV